MMTSHIIMMREHREVNTDPQRRCYNGCHYSSEIIPQYWEVLEHVEAERVDERLAFWQNLNAYAVSQRGKSAHTDFKAITKEQLQ